MVEVIYTSYAFPPYGLSADGRYSFGHDSKGYFLVIKNEHVTLSLDVIKMLLTPVDMTWEEAIKKVTYVPYNDKFKKKK